jgi:hypothetical protein
MNDAIFAVILRSNIPSAVHTAYFNKTPQSVAEYSSDKTDAEYLRSLWS